MSLNRILLVDDEANLLASLKRQLHRQPYEILSAQSGAEGLDILRRTEAVSVIVSDYRMPGMDGIEFLSKSQEISPDAVRIMLTGSNETEVAIRAVNQGNIFRFLLKPVAPETLLGTISAGIKQYNLVISERSLLAELTAMQQIDRELNASLDLGRAMNITLTQAVSQTGSSAGLIGRVVDGDIKVMASCGYGDELSPYNGSLPPDKFPAMIETLQNARPGDEYLPGAGGLFDSSKCHALVPIQREGKAAGLLYIENASGSLESEDVERFLVRLCDHAAVAISNAELYEAARAANQAKSEFVSFVAHELKNPITSISGFAEMLEDDFAGQANSMHMEMITGIRASANRMITLVKDLGDISQIETGHLKLNINSWDIHEIINEVSSAMKPHFEAKKQALILRIPENTPPVLADKNRMIQVLTNLLSNAGKYSPAGSDITLEGAVCSNSGNPEDRPGALHLQVQDRGIGISETDRRKIFQKFFRSADSSMRGTPGTGLGLNITRNLVELQGGKIWFESEHGKGSTFHFTVPVENR